ncbi:GNAT family N-acetyltransferase [Streptomyces sp. NPDC021093]|uniref:GNAT family N-acetyltransferase n=1 Tax=Streptomyces sp. NPDC021093 TaxID=3365112 RepID=UPI0037885CFF
MTDDPTLPISLRPATEDDLPMLESFLADPQAVGPFQWKGWSDPGVWRRRWAECRLLDGVSNILIVHEGDTRCGLVGWRRERTAGTSHCWNMGAQLLPSATGRGIGTRAQLLLVHSLFESDPIPRIEADTEVTNVAERRSLEKCGFTQEGVMRSRAFRAGAWRDIARYSILRDDPLPPL